ncbi:DUF4224 domain-containing protein [Achromobacter kerstersii]|uniref:DUF4224 domain-containing protein n=1 Tax=Achromobacter kerstersii TaxID=1353890 RepID=UPI003CC7AE04
MSEYLTASELAELVGCKANQRAAMANWLTANRWSYVVTMNGLPRVLREYRNRKLGLVDEQRTKARLEASPNVDAFRRPARTHRSGAAL